MQEEQADAPGTIVALAVADGCFETLVAAVTAADLVGTLSGEGPFTVFAPTDDAFAALPEGTVETLLEDIPTLTDILLYHVVPGDVRAAKVVTLDSAVTVQGEAVSITVEGDRARIDDSLIVIADIVASNGVIHVVAAALLPPAAWGHVSVRSRCRVPRAGSERRAKLAVLDQTPVAASPLARPRRACRPLARGAAGPVGARRPYPRPSKPPPVGALPGACPSRRRHRRVSGDGPRRGAPARASFRPRQDRG
ncbi:MAG: fasciclin domain-containing protein [Chloroflexi bacterium]|nr:fasciclin domain-containing protein [Chloroflexota bacterium]MXX81767.1 fasciclin domain-containing protein [Chloroflexota bacterium]MYF21824.1 fasciclin domain-containing protein [Chloroflexota bacterium]